MFSLHRTLRAGRFWNMSIVVRALSNRKTAVAFTNNDAVLHQFMYLFFAIFYHFEHLYRSVHLFYSFCFAFTFCTSLETDVKDPTEKHSTGNHRLSITTGTGTILSKRYDSEIAITTKTHHTSSFVKLAQMKFPIATQHQKSRIRTWWVDEYFQSLYWIKILKINIMIVQRVFLSQYCIKFHAFLIEQQPTTHLINSNIAGILAF